MNDYGHIVISCNKKGFFPKVIRFVTGSKFSHTLLTIPSVCGEEMGLEAAHVGVAALPFETFYRKNRNLSYRVYRFKADPKARDRAIVNALFNLQKGYGFLELAWFVWRSLNKFLGRDIRSQKNWSQAGIICSELVAAYISDAGYPFLFAGFGMGSINAQDVFETCESHPEIFELIEIKE